MKKLERLLLRLDMCKIPRNLTTYLFDMIPLTTPHVLHPLISVASLSPFSPFSSTLVSLFRPRDLIRTSSQKRCVWIFPFAPSKNRGNPGQELNHSQARLIDVFASNGTMYSRQRCNVVLGRDSVHRGNGKTFKAPRNTKCSCVRYLCESRR